MRPKLSIELVDNGYIVRVNVTGASLLKDPYEKPVLVFMELEDLIATLRVFATKKVFMRPESGMRPDGQ